MLEMVRCLDSFTGQQSRLVIVVDGLDSCEQSKVLSVLDAVQVHYYDDNLSHCARYVLHQCILLQTLFSDPGSPFIILLAIDPHVIIKAIELNINQAFSDTSIGGNSYLRNLVHLPFFLQNSGLRKVKVAQAVATNLRSKSSSVWLEVDDASQHHRKMSSESGLFRKLRRESVHHSRMGSSRGGDGVESIASSMGNINKAGTSSLQGPQDLTKV